MQVLWWTPILADVRTNGDAAVRCFTTSRSTASVTDLPMEVSREEIEARVRASLIPALVEALRLAAERITAYHKTQLKHAATSFEEDGVGQIVRPIERVGLYIPGNKVIYPSTVLMTADPGAGGGEKDLVVVTPMRWRTERWPG